MLWNRPITGFCLNLSQINRSKTSWHIGCRFIHIFPAQKSTIDSEYKRENDPLRVSIVGRSNVGKSSLFNRVQSLQRAIVFDQPGTTREGKRAVAGFGRLLVDWRDTGGWESNAVTANTEVLQKMRQRLSDSINESEIVLFVYDAKEGVTPLDLQAADWLKAEISSKFPGPSVLLVANKCESADEVTVAAEAWELGLGPPVLVSAKQNQGFEDLYDQLLVLEGALRPSTQSGESQEQSSEEYAEEVAEDIETIADESDSPAVRIAFVGRPNTGKSSLLNSVIRCERAITHGEAGTTTDALEVEWEFGGKHLTLIDTAGVNRGWKFHQTPQLRDPAMETLRALRKADVVVVVVDSDEVRKGGGLGRHEMAIAKQASEEGRCVVIAVNKWDILNPNQQKVVRKAIMEKVEVGFSQVKGLPLVFLSAKTGLNVKLLITRCLGVYHRWSIRIPTSALNAWLRAFVTHFPPIWKNKQKCNIKYLTQTNIQPPYFVLWTNISQEFPDNYLQQMRNALREEFNLQGPPIVFSLRSTFVPRSIAKTLSKKTKKAKVSYKAGATLE